MAQPDGVGEVRDDAQGRRLPAAQDDGRACWRWKIDDDDSPWWKSAGWQARATTTMIEERHHRRRARCTGLRALLKLWAALGSPCQVQTAWRNNAQAGEQTSPATKDCCHPASRRSRAMVMIVPARLAPGNGRRGNPALRRSSSPAWTLAAGRPLGSWRPQSPATLPAARSLEALHGQRR